MNYHEIHVIFPPGEAIWKKMQEIGYTFELYILWDRAYVTADVNVIKVKSSVPEVTSIVSDTPLHQGNACYRLQ